jgi:hypothetical protein
MWLRRKKTALLEGELIKFIDSALVDADWSCTQCLIDELGNESGELADVIAELKSAYLLLFIAPDGEAAFAAALGEFLGRVTKMALYTAELMHRPGVRWADTTVTAAWPTVSPN